MHAYGSYEPYQPVEAFVADEIAGEYRSLNDALREASPDRAAQLRAKHVTSSVSSWVFCFWDRPHSILTCPAASHATTIANLIPRSRTAGRCISGSPSISAGSAHLSSASSSFAAGLSPGLDASTLPRR
eukprot:7215843-Prymnesium_polylepis.1